MEKISAIILDDEASAIRSLRGMLHDFCPTVHLITALSDVDQAIEAVHQYKPDVLFLDIEMPPYGTAFDFLQQTEKVSFGVIFTTAHAHYAVKAINEVHPWAYLIKPFRAPELIKALHTATSKQHKPAPISNLAYKGIILSDTRKGSVVARYIDILYCEADGPITTYHMLRNGKMEKMSVSKNLKEVEKDLPESIFCRVHHSFIVNMIHVARFERRGRSGVLHLPEERLVDVSCQRIDGFFAQFQEFLQGGD